MTAKDSRIQFLEGQVVVLQRELTIYKAVNPIDNRQLNQTVNPLDRYPRCNEPLT